MADTAPSPLRVLMVTPNFPPHRGGVETHTYEVSRRLGALGLAVEVLTTDRSGVLPREEVMAGVPVRRVAAFPSRGDLYWSPAVARYVSRATADLIHCQGYHTFVPILAMMAARRRGVPYVLTFHSGGHSSRLRHASRPLQIRLLRRLLLGARRLIAVSDFEAEQFRRALGVDAERVVVIPNGIDLSDGPDGARDRDPALILSVGRLERYKGHDRLVRALRHVRQELPSARLRILGDGPDAARLGRLAERSGVAGAVAIGALPREEMRAALQEASVVALLSEYESHGLGVHEALLFGCRIVTLDSSALGELRDVSQALVVSAEASDRVVADALLAQLRAGPVTDPPPTASTWDDCAGRLAELYREVAVTARP